MRIFRTLIDDYRQSKLPSDKIDAVKKYLSANCKLALKKNGLINFRKLGGLLDCHHQTARSWCDLFNIKSKTL
ncbi:MAG: hypothetical protein U5K00_12195 [Melioribacteraceae bacterium]|nr:hypothetical protein [Melioribacteraceae bacterium]